MVLIQQIQGQEKKQTLKQTNICMETFYKTEVTLKAAGGKRQKYVVNAARKFFVWKKKKKIGVPTSYPSQKSITDRLKTNMWKMKL